MSTHITLHTVNGSVVLLPSSLITVQQYKGQTWVGPIGDHSDPTVEVVESPEQITELIQAAQEKRWREQIAAQVIAQLAVKDCRGTVDGLAREALDYADAIIAADKSRCTSAADIAQLLADAKNALAIFKPRFGGGADAHAETVAWNNLQAAIAKVEATQ